MQPKHKQQDVQIALSLQLPAEGAQAGAGLLAASKDNGRPSGSEKKSVAGSNSSTSDVDPTIPKVMMMHFVMHIIIIIIMMYMLCVCCMLRSSCARSMGT